MRTLLFLSLSLSLVACGDDDGGRPGTDGGTDSGPITVDGGPDVDSGPITDPDGGSDADSGGGTSDCNVGGTCNVLSNDCTTAGEGCYLDEGPSGCYAAGSLTEGQACSNLNDCREGLGCFGSEETGYECRRLCCQSSGGTECNTGDLCLGFTNAPGDLGFCRTPSGCDAIEQSGCDDGEACVVISSDGSLDCVAGAGGTLTQGQDCAPEDARCAAGFICLGPVEGPNFCGHFCDPTATTSPCEDGTTCGGITGFPENLGACVPAS